MVLLELLGRKQTLRILWELRDEPATFRALQERCGGISPTILNRRITEMRSSGMVEHQPSLGYTLTSEGTELLVMLLPLRVWAEKWEKRIESQDLDDIS
ncbi:MAG: DNA-binding HxlR family transcriptional regulator [Gammaproteobacteria bacterium]|jgi:DNA-binding HxlR family transcriptional regulator